MYKVVVISIIVTLISIALIVFIINNVSNKRWRCIEGTCETDINGEYASKSACINACKNVQQARQDLDAWACTSEAKCVKSDQGYTSKELCEQNCTLPTSYVPQSLLWFPGYRNWSNRWYDRPRKWHKRWFK